jgi:hypothetical protein
MLVLAYAMPWFESHHCKTTTTTTTNTTNQTKEPERGVLLKFHSQCCCDDSMSFKIA